MGAVPLRGTDTAHDGQNDLASHRRTGACLSVCPRAYISETTRDVQTSAEICLTAGCGLVLLTRRRCAIRYVLPVFSCLHIMVMKYATCNIPVLSDSPGAARTGQRSVYHRERKCADTTGTVLVPCMGWPFPMLKCKYICQTIYTEAISSNSTRKLLWFEITKILIAVLKS